ncbi:MAG TPA: DUF58 domain-containing protein [Longimicrobium sp.]|nr:DUF58 domain-containing protein [Longimicrobium sp.]
MGFFRRRPPPSPSSADPAPRPPSRWRRSAKEAPPPATASPAPALPDVLGQVRRVELRTRGLVSSRFSGEYHSVFKGQGIEFVEVREYLPGDDVRAIDWNVSARTGETFVKKYVEERELTVLLAVDLSGSQRFGTRGRFKSDMVAEVAASLAMSAVRNNDRVGLLVFTDRVELFVPPRKGRRHVLRILRDLLSFRPAGVGTDLAVALEYAVRVLRSRSIVFLVSDFQGAASRAFEKALAVAAHRHDLVPVVLADPAEAELPDAGLLQVRDPESGALVAVDSGSERVRERYAEAVREERAALKRSFRRLGLDEIALSTDQPTSTAILSFFRRRERRLRQ